MNYTDKLLVQLEKAENSRRDLIEMYIKINAKVKIIANNEYGFNEEMVIFAKELKEILDQYESKI